MNTKELADFLGITPNTLRRWAADYHEFLSPAAHPPKGQVRLFDNHDARVLHFVSASREIGRQPETIMAQLAGFQADNWEGLPDLPLEWGRAPEPMPTETAVRVGYDAATVAVLQRDLAQSQSQLAEARERVTALESELHAIRANSDSQGAKIHTLELELSDARGQVAAVEARLSAYAITGGDKPIPVAAIVAVTALVAVAVVVLVFVVARLLL